MKTCKQGQRIKVFFENDFHNTGAVGIVKIVRVVGDSLIIEMPLSTRKRVEKKIVRYV